MAILEIEIGAEEQTRLQQGAQQAGLSIHEWARRRLFGMPPVTFTTNEDEVIILSDTGNSRRQERQLVTEYHALTTLERQGRLSEAQAERRRQVEAELDELEAQDPLEQLMDRRLQETTDKLDEALELLRRLPKKDPEPKAAGQ